MGYIYLRTNRYNGKKYVGQVTTKRFKQRQKSWNCLSQPYAGPVINNARKKYGLDAFDFEILKECKDEELNQWEMYYIKELNTKAPNGYNLTDGGDGMNGYSPSEETRRKIGEANKGKEPWIKGKHLSKETKNKISESKKGIPNIKLSKFYKSEKRWNYGKHLSEEHKKKLSESHKGKQTWRKGKHLSEETRMKMSNSHLKKEIFQIDMNTGEIIMEFQSLMEVQRQLGYDNGSVSRCCNGKRQTAYGFKWEYKKVS